MEILLDRLLADLASAVRAGDRRAVRELLREALIEAKLATAYLDSWTPDRHHKLLGLLDQIQPLLRGTPEEGRIAEVRERLPETTT